jgi:hypothetical protein
LADWLIVQGYSQEAANALVQDGLQADLASSKTGQPTTTSTLRGRP